jgi:hypothetical protein
MKGHNFYVYEHWRLDRDECFYVGKGKGNRAYNMKNRNRHHKAVVAKVMREGYAIEIRMVSTGITEPDAFELEVERIAFWRASGADLANMTLGGEGKTGPHQADHKKNISKALKGKKKSANVILAVIESNKKRKGMKHPARSREHIENLSKSLVGRVAPNKKRVACIEDGHVFESATSAALFYGLKSVSSVSEVCRGNKKTSSGRSFKYVEVS